MKDSLQTILVIGASGDLGYRISQAIIDIGHSTNLRAAARGGLSGKHVNTLRQLSDQGAAIYSAELDDLESLKRACEGAHTVISVVQGGPETIIGGQEKLLQACLAAGVQRFVPSDFSENLFAIPAGINPYLDWRRTFDGEVTKSGIGYTHILNGGFMEAVFTSPGLIDGKAETLTYWGDGEVPLDFTAMDDVARYAARIVLDPKTLNQTAGIVGDRLTVGEIVADYQAATGISLRLIRRGSIAEGYAELDRMKLAGAHPMAMLPMQYLLPMMSGEGLIEHPCNSNYREIKPTTLRSYFERCVAAGDAIGVS